MDTLTKKDVVEDLIIKLGLGRKEASDSFENFLETIKETLEKGEDVSLSGFGKFSTRDKRKRRGRNPKTGEKLMITERRAITFSLSNVLRAQLEGKK